MVLMETMLMVLHLLLKIQNLFFQHGIKNVSVTVTDENGSLRHLVVMW